MEKEESEDQIQTEFYERALTELAEAKTDEEKMDALESILLYATDPKKTLTHVDQLELLSRRSNSRDSLLTALHTRVVGLTELAKSTGEWSSAREAAQALISEHQQGATEPRELLLAKAALARIETGAGRFAEAETELSEAEKLAKTVSYSEELHPGFSEDGDVTEILEGHWEIAKARGETEKAALIRQQLDVLKERMDTHLSEVLADSERRVAEIMKKYQAFGGLGYAPVALGILFILSVIYRVFL